MSVKNEQDVLYRRESDSSEPQTKHARKSSTTEYTRSSVTILDVLEVDICRRGILDNFGLLDILRMECVCQRWSNSILHYVRGAVRFRRRLYLMTPTLKGLRGERKGGRGRLRVEETRGRWFERALFKWGKSVEVAPCVVDSFPIVTEYCPYLEQLVVYGIPEQDVISDGLENLINLEQITFRKQLDSPAEGFGQNPDDSIHILLQKDTLQYLSVIGNDHLTGTCFNKLQANLTTLRLEGCPAIDYRQLCTISLPDLKTLELSGLSSEILHNIHILLDKLPKLEGLELSEYDYVEFDWRVFERLTSLKHLNLSRNQAVTDMWLKAVAGQKLNTLDVSYCEGVTLEGLLSFCSPSGVSLNQLGVSGHHYLRNQDLEFTIRLCPYLWVLDVRDCLGLTSELVPYLAHILRRRGRRRLPRLTLRLRGTAVTDTQIRHLDRYLILDFSEDSQASPEPSDSNPDLS